MGLNVPLLEPSAEQAVNAHTMSISARSSMQSPALERGGSTATTPSAVTSTRMKMLKVVPMRAGSIPKGSKALARFSKQLGWYPLWRYRISTASAGNHDVARHPAAR